MADYTRKIIRAPKGSARREVELNDVQIPDMWHLAMALKKVAKKIQGMSDDERDMLSDLIGDSINTNPGSWEDSAEQVLETWYLAHDLKANLAGDTDA